MATGVGEAVFVDTNILVYASIAEAPFHEAARMALERLAEEGSELWTSRQVLREYLAVLSRPQAFAPPIPVSSLVAEVQHFQQRFQVAEDGIGVTRLLLQLMEQVSIAGKQVHDANIVATMQAHGLRHLLTHNTADFVRFSHLITVVPLEVSP